MIKITGYSDDVPKIENDWNIKLVDGDFIEGETVTVEIDGKTYKRKVYYGDGDLYITVKNTKYFPSDIVY